MRVSRDFECKANARTLFQISQSVSIIFANFKYRRKEVSQEGILSSDISRCVVIEEWYNLNIQNYVMMNVRAIVQELETEIRITVVYKLTTNRNYVIGVRNKRKLLLLRRYDIKILLGFYAYDGSSFWMDTSVPRWKENRREKIDLTDLFTRSLKFNILEKIVT